MCDISLQYLAVSNSANCKYIFALIIKIQKALEHLKLCISVDSAFHYIKNLHISFIYNDLIYEIFVVSCYMYTKINRVVIR